MTGPTRGSVAGPEAPRGTITVQGDHGPVTFQNLSIVTRPSSDHREEFPPEISLMVSVCRLEISVGVH